MHGGALCGGGFKGEMIFLVPSFFTLVLQAQLGAMSRNQLYLGASRRKWLRWTCGSHCTFPEAKRTSVQNEENKAAADCPESGRPLREHRMSVVDQAIGFLLSRRFAAPALRGWWSVRSLVAPASLLPRY